MVWRQVRFDLPAGVAVFEQTDYGHPGRFNAWEPRELPAGLQARVGELATVAEQLSVLVT